MASTALKQRSQQYLGFADVVGASEVSSFHQALQYSVHTDTQSLSIAGQTFNSEEARGLSITTQLQDVFLHPHKSCLALNVTYTNCYPVSSASLIESISATIG